MNIVSHSRQASPVRRAENAQPVRVLDDAFSRRPPSSPILEKTPRKPKPPARSRTHTKAPRASVQGETNDDPLLLSATVEGTYNHIMPNNLTSRARTQRTLDVELNQAAARYAEVEDDVFIAVGTRPTELGYLAHGGAAGRPVYMGEQRAESASPEPSRSKPKRRNKR